jgi:non-specific serine/threonine protein kinase
VKAAEMKLPAEPVLRGNLPYALSSFVGREREIAAVVQELASSRLVTLTGTGGTGKTRLAIQVARQLEERFPHKAWLVELAPLTDASLIPQTIAAALRLKQHPGRSLLETLQDYLYDKRLLIVLDNCEHLVAGSAQVADGLLHACPQVRILATSRERLGSEGEVVYSVPPLTLPEDPGQMTLLSISQSEAAQLFVERARAALPGYTPTAEEAAAIVQICRRLDGLPLALELAAARLSAFDVQQIAARLEENFSTLGAGRWTSFPHQQTLQASIEWSYNLLSEPERILLRRLAVFAGGWTLPAVEAVCADEEDPGCIASIPVIDLLNQLVQKSLVRVERKLGLESRYTMLEIVRKFTTEKLAESDDEEWLSDRHLAYYHWLAEMNDRLLWTDASEPGMALMTVEIDNFRRALGWSVIEPVLVRLMGGLRLLVALRTFWRRAGLNYDEYKFWVDKLLKLAPGEGIEWKHLRGKALNSAIWWFTRPQEASRILTESVELLREVDDLPELANALTKLAGIFTMFDLNLASRPVEEAITIYREIGDKSGLGFALSVRSVLALYEYDFDVAAVCARECIELFHQIDYRWEIHEPFSIMAFVHAVRGEELPAREYVKEALKVSMQIEMVTDERILTYGRIGIIYYLLNDFEQMELVLLPIKNQLFGTRNTTTLIWARRSLGIARKRLGKYQEAAADFLASVPDTEFVDDPYGVYAALAGIAGVAVHTGHASVAARLLGKVAEFFEGFTKPLDLIEMREFDFDLATVRAALSEAEFAHAWDAGKALTLEQAKSEAQVFVTQFLR